MCIIGTAPPGVPFDPDHIASCARKNSDGFGIAVVKNGELVIFKSLMKSTCIPKGLDLDEIQKIIKANEAYPRLIHFRIKTHGTISKHNCHPFRVNEELALAHNGMMSILHGPKESDTSAYVRWLSNTNGGACLKLGEDPTCERICKLHEDVIGNSILAYLRKDGTFFYLNKSRGNQLYNGVWFSNMGYFSYTSSINTTNHNSRSSYYGTRGYSGYMCDDDDDDVIFGKHGEFASRTPTPNRGRVGFRQPLLPPVLRNNISEVEELDPLFPWVETNRFFPQQSPPPSPNPTTLETKGATEEKASRSNDSANTPQEKPTGLALVGINELPTSCPASTPTTSKPGKAINLLRPPPTIITSQTIDAVKAARGELQTNPNWGQKKRTLFSNLRGVVSSFGVTSVGNGALNVTPANGKAPTIATPVSPPSLSKEAHDCRNCPCPSTTIDPSLTIDFGFPDDSDLQLMKAYFCCRNARQLFIEQVESEGLVWENAKVPDPDDVVCVS